MKWTDVKFTDELFVQTDISVSKNYSESAVLKLAKMALDINDNNIVGFDSIGSVCIGKGYLAQMKDLAKEIIGDDCV